MIDASQAKVVGYITDDGEFIHESHLPDDVIEQAEAAALDAKAPTGHGWRIFDEFIENAGYRALIRYHIHEIESQRAYDIDAGEFMDDALSGDFDNLTVLELVNRYAAVYCDECGERIE